jgi:hypothetical protein
MEAAVGPGQDAGLYYVCARSDTLCKTLQTPSITIDIDQCS